MRTFVESEIRRTIRNRYLSGRIIVLLFSLSMWASSRHLRNRIA